MINYMDENGYGCNSDVFDIFKCQNFFDGITSFSIF